MYEPLAGWMVTEPRWVLTGSCPRGLMLLLFGEEGRCRVCDSFRRLGAFSRVGRSHKSLPFSAGPFVCTSFSSVFGLVEQRESARQQYPCPPGLTTLASQKPLSCEHDGDLSLLVLRIHLPVT